MLSATRGALLVKLGLLALIVTVFSSWSVLDATAAKEDVKINEVESNGGVPGDWVELYNAGPDAVDISGWVVRDNDDTHTFTIPASTVIAAGDFYIADVDASFGLGAGDTARLYDELGALLDSYAWTEHASTTYGRCPDGTGAFRTTSSSTRGTANDCSLQVAINEIESSGGTPGDWVELYNFGSGPADISGWIVSDSDDTHDFVIPAGTIVAAGGFYVAEVEASFGLGGGDSARLFDGFGVLVDSYTWSAHAAMTYGRCPDGTGGFTDSSSVTKGSSNDCSSPIKINEVESNGGVPGDWVELYNLGPDAVDISGWVVRDNDDTHTFTIPASTVIAAGGFYVADVDPVFGLGGEDTARLFNLEGALVDSYSWTAHAGTTYGRCPDGSGDFAETATSTREAANDCAPTGSTVRVNEVESDGGAPGDWVELYNLGPDAVDVSGWIVRDNDDTHTFTIPESTVIAAGGFYVADVDPVFGLGGADSARLFNLEGALVDSYAWTAHASTTYGRCPDGIGPFATTIGATKGLANDCPVFESAVVVNEVESSGGTPGDWTELFNPGPDPVDISGYGFRDNDETHAIYVIPGGTIIPAGGFYVLEEAAFGFGLGAGDTANLYAPDLITVVDAYTWTAHSPTTYGRCPDGTGVFQTTTNPTKGTANDCTPPVNVNEVESSGGVPGDWVEFINTSPDPVDVSGFVFRDNDDTHAYTLPAGSVIPAGGYLVIEEAAIGFGLGGADSARLFDTFGALVDSYAWTDHAVGTTYGRCPNGTGDFATTTTVTKGSLNHCPGELLPESWPGSETIATADVQNALGGDVSGLAYEESGSAQPGTLWASQNSGSLYRLIWDGTSWVPDAASGWGAGRSLVFTDGTGIADAEGVTFAESSAGGVYVSSERNNANNSVSRNSILRYDVSGADATLTATHEWDVTAALPATGANTGLEAITWVPDSYLVANGFVDESTGATYDPGDYPNHGDGVFIVGIEADGMFFAFVLNHGDGSFTKIATVDTQFVGIMALEFDHDLEELWVVCDDGCQGRSAVATIDGDGHFEVIHVFDRPSGMPNLNNEGFAIAALEECAAGARPVFWSDDTNTEGHAIRAGNLACTPPGDGDGIDDTIDTDPGAFSNDFSDGTTFGSVLDRGDQTITVEPAVSGGIQITADNSSGAPAIVSACDAGEFTLDSGESIIVTCGSVIVEVVVGPVEASFMTDDGEVTVNLDTGYGLTFDPDTDSFTADDGNPGPVTLHTPGGDILVEPGETYPEPVTAPSCNGQTATVYVNAEGRIVGGVLDGLPFFGILTGTNGADVVVGTNGGELIVTDGGADIVCAEGGNDIILAGAGSDSIDGGPGSDLCSGGAGRDTATRCEIKLLIP